MSEPLPQSIDATADLLADGKYIADRSLATTLYLALQMGRPLFLEGEAGVGKTEIAKVLSETLKRPLVRLQCYEGLDVASAVYEWNYSRQMIEIRLAEAAGNVDRTSLGQDIFREEYLIKRPLMESKRSYISQRTGRNGNRCCPASTADVYGDSRINACTGVSLAIRTATPLPSDAPRSTVLSGVTPCACRKASAARPS